MPCVPAALDTLCQLLYRRKSISKALSTDTKLDKCLSTFDLTFLGIGCTLGAGLYVVIGQIAKSVAGPSVVLCFLIAAIASILSGLCYAEFGSRVPKAGSAYLYSYVTVGEIWAFVIGWNLVLEYVIGSASVARAASAYFDAMLDHRISSYLTAHLPIHVPTLSPYPDFVAFFLTIAMSVILCFGMRESSIINNIFTIINLFVISYVVICGLFKVDSYNWHIPADKVPNPEVNGVGGFFPYGFLGMISGAGSCFYSYVGFDIIATAGEETVNPQKSIPIAITACLVICATAYILPSIILTLMVPYYSLDSAASLPSAFGQVGWYVAEHIIDVGAICSLTTCLLTSICAMPRIIYAMASDGLLFKFLAKVNERFQTPIMATLISGVFTGLMAMLFELIDLVDMMSIGTLLAYTLVAVCILLLRYENSFTEVVVNEETECTAPPPSCLQQFVRIFKPKTDLPTYRTFCTVKICISAIATMTTWSSLILIYLYDEIVGGVWWAILLVVLPNIFMLLALAVIWRQPQKDEELTFEVPLVPLLPAISIVINIYLMLNLTVITWYRFAIWLSIGFLIYFLYGIRHSGDDEHKTDNYTELDGANGTAGEVPAGEVPAGEVPAGSAVVTTDRVEHLDKSNLISSDSLETSH